MSERLTGLGNFVTACCKEGFISIPRIFFTRPASLKLNYSDIGIIAILFYLTERQNDADYADQVAGSGLYRDAIDRGCRMRYVEMVGESTCLFNFADDFISQIIPADLTDVFRRVEIADTDHIGTGDVGLEKMLTSMQQDLIEKDERIKLLEYELRFKNRKKDIKPDEKEKSTSEAKKCVYDAMENLWGRPISTRECRYVDEWFSDYGFEEKAIILILEHFYAEGKDKISYLNTVIRDWKDRDVLTVDKVMAELEKRKESKMIYDGIRRYLSFDRPLTVPEKKKVAVWQSDWGFDDATIYRACDMSVNSRNPTIAYINKILENWKANGIQSDGGSENIAVPVAKKNPAKGKINDEFKEYEEYSRAQGVRAGKVRE